MEMNWSLWRIWLQLAARVSFSDFPTLSGHSWLAARILPFQKGFTKHSGSRRAVAGAAIRNTDWTLSIGTSLSKARHWPTATATMRCCTSFIAWWRSQNAIKQNGISAPFKMTMTWIEGAKSPDRDRVSGPVMLSAQFAVPVHRRGQAARERGP